MLCKSIELRKERLINDGISLQVRVDLKCKQRGEHSHSETDHPSSALAGPWVDWLHRCHEEYRQTIVPVRSIVDFQQYWQQRDPPPGGMWHWYTCLVFFCNLSHMLGNRMWRSRCGSVASRCRCQACGVWWCGDTATLGWKPERQHLACSRLLKRFSCCLPKQVLCCLFFFEMTAWISSENYSIKSDEQGRWPAEAEITPPTPRLLLTGRSWQICNHVKMIWIQKMNKLGTKHDKTSTFTRHFLFLFF